MITPTTPVPALVMAGYDAGRRSGLRALRRPPTGAMPAHKALLPLNGRPLVAYTVDALRSSPRVGSMTLVGFDPSECDLGNDLYFLPNRSSLLENVMAGLRAVWAREPQAPHVLVTGSDAPLLTPEAITWFVDACGARTADLYMAIVARETVLASFPEARRTWLRTRAGAFCSADLFLARPQAMLAQQARLRRLLNRRKSPAALVQTVGLRWLLRFLLGRVHPDDLRTAARQVAGVEMRPVILPFAAAAMDIDRPDHLAPVQVALARNSVIL